MTDRAIDSFDLTDLSPEAWLSEIETIGEAHGSFEMLGEAHAALHMKGAPLLLVTFESIDTVLAERDKAMPLGVTLADQSGFSLLTIYCQGETWFRDPAVYAYFDKLIDEGFFEDFDRVVFYGAGSCGYAAGAFSVAAPGATVLLVTPQATLDPTLAPWDERFTQMRRVSFTDRYGYAPDMIDAADHVYILFDPAERMDAMHAALFRRSNVTLLRCRHFGSRVEPALLRLHVLDGMIEAATEGALTESGFWRHFRERRNFGPWLHRVLTKLDEQDRALLKYWMASNVVNRFGGRRFRKAMQSAQTELQAKGKLPLDAPEDQDKADA